MSGAARSIGWICRQCAAFFTPTRDDHVFYRGGIDGLIEALTKRHEHIVFSMHHLGNVIIHFMGLESARVESYAVVTQHTAGLLEKELAVTTTWCRYIDKFEQRGGEWRVLHRTLVIDATVTSRVQGDTNSSIPEGNRGRRDRLDPSYPR
ncbi:nuclear transport factor 2 family protein [Caballeronia sp. 15715]|uniref:nuclear transport factor 2 family protein n=1 Tax=Caballeronia sp. 15715 TaxID=3391030 RepID=UPI0039E21D2A